MQVWAQFALTPNKAPVAVQTHGTEVHRSRDNRRGEGHLGWILVPWKVPLDVKTGMLEGNPGADGSRRFHGRVLHDETGSTPPRALEGSVYGTQYIHRYAGGYAVAGDLLGDVVELGRPRVMFVRGREEMEDFEMAVRFQCRR